ncbi:hypothetical protein TNCT_652831 [Trichonephila clavata]|uniref:Uncharacterized protein n=1 Tax=Trichonephila clavata TaxID=2740835 RepID=A0A8X6H751_TRICU|nr:hypothetical protein TNCT_652831 [Trichonephila clavata]
MRSKKLCHEVVVRERSFLIDSAVDLPSNESGDVPPTQSRVRMPEGKDGGRGGPHGSWVLCSEPRMWGLGAACRW